MRVCRWVVAAMLAVCGVAQAQVGEEPEKTHEDAASPVAQKSPAPSAAHISSGVMAGLKLGGSAPVYPASAKAAHLEGTVVLHAIINGEGKIENLVPVSGPFPLRDAAIDAVKHWTYRPYTLAGNPVSVDTTVIVNFRMSEGSGMPDVIPISSSVAVGLLTQHANPRYPEEAKANHVEGKVRLSLNIDTKGIPQNVNALSGPELLQPAAVEAVKKWRFTPYMLNGKPVVAQTTMVLNFKAGQD